MTNGTSKRRGYAWGQLTRHAQKPFPNAPSEGRGKTGSLDREVTERTGLTEPRSGTELLN